MKFLFIIAAEKGKGKQEKGRTEGGRVMDEKEREARKAFGCDHAEEDILEIWRAYFEYEKRARRKEILFFFIGIPIIGILAGAGFSILLYIFSLFFS